MAETSGDDPADRGNAPAGAASDPLGERRIGEVSESSITQPRLARASVAPEPARLADAGDDASADPVTDPYATDPFADPTRRDATRDATSEPIGDPVPAAPGDERDERAEAYQLALRGQLAGLQRRVAVAEAQEPALREQLADLQRRLAEAEARQGGASSRRRFGLALAVAFAAGLIVMFAVSRLSDDRRAAASGRGAPAAANAAPAAPIVTPIDLPADRAPRDAGPLVDPFAGH